MRKDNDAVSKGAAALHQACIDRWAQIEPGMHAGITKHGVDAHEAQARAVLDAVLPGVRRATWLECVRWLAVHGQGNVKGRLLDDAELANPYDEGGTP